ncbi:MAG: TIGR01459 family HAD-type hydrolase [Hyphomonadaceae bacterium]|nr:TIGR01459 family HAD-type hydrolase [Hyphomonadaceae bacterium]
MDILESLDAVAARYDAVLCDVWGVVHNGKRAYGPACAALQRFRARGGAVALVTNVPRPRGPIPAQLDKLGVPRDAWDIVVTSGDAIRAALKARAPGPMYKIGPAYDASLWEGLGLRQSELSEAAFVAISGLNHDDVETPADYADILQAMRVRDLELICANPDIVVRVGERLVWCAGAIARDYEKIGGRVVMAGKPHPPIYDLAYTELSAHLGRASQRSRLLAIGDGIATDVRGANREGIDCLFVASGMHGEALMTGGKLDLTKVDAALAQEGVSARYAMAELG